MSDKWLDWLTSGRDAGQQQVRQRHLQMLMPIRDRVLTAAEIRPGDAVLDVGTGQGLLGLAALDQVDPGGRVIFNDISSAAITSLQERLTSHEAHGRASFAVAPAETLQGVTDASVDVGMMRSVLIYVSDRRSAMAALRRVLRPGGTLSVYEPLASLYPPADCGRGYFFGWHVPAVADAADRVTRAYLGQTALGDSSALLSLGMRELPDLAESAGFEQVSFSVEGSSASCASGDDSAVRAVVDGRPNPNAPSPREVAASVLDTEEARLFIAELEAAVRGGRGRQRHAGLYMTAR